MISEYPSLQKEIISYYSKIPKKNIFFNKDNNFIIDYEIYVDNLNKIKNRNSYIIQTKNNKKYLSINDFYLKNLYLNKVKIALIASLSLIFLP